MKSLASYLRLPRSLFSPLTLLLSLSLVGNLAIATDGWCDSPGDASAATQIVTDKKLWESPSWRTLLHCRASDNDWCDSASASGLITNVGEVDSAQVELTHTVKEIYSDYGKGVRGDDSFYCRFPARVAWLAGELSPHGITLPHFECASFASWYGVIAPHSLTVIFPTSFLNNPASAFGHTLLRFDRKGAASKERLASYTANFSADAVDQNSILYGLKGVFGGYFGFFSVAPYYDKVKLYSDLEDRDIWEYELSLTPNEVDRIVRHLWELRSVPFYYHYFDDNCSFQLLSILEVGRPTIRFTDKFPLWVTPVDTLREIAAEPGLVSATTFRPSLASALQHRTAQATSDEIAWASAVVKGESPEDNNPVGSLTNSDAHSFSARDKAARLELAYDMATYATIRGTIDETKRESLSWELLAARSKISGVTPFSPHPTPEFSPHQGHATLKMSAGFGANDEQTFGRFTLRPAFHDHNDNARGYLAGAQIKFLDSALRVQEDEGAIVERFDLLDVESLAPRRVFYAPISWGLRIGANHGYFNAVDAPFVYSLAGGPGVSYELPFNSLFYALVEGEIQGSKNLDVGWALGGGPKVGLQFTPTDPWRLSVESLAARYVAGDLGTVLGVRLVNDVALSKSISVRATVSHATTREVEESIIMGELVYYGSPTL